MAFDDQQPGAAMDDLTIERFGGLAGFGLPGSRIKSRGQMALADLSAADRAAVESLFDSSYKAEPPMPDGFRYRITRQTAKGTKTVEAAEHHVPLALRNVIKDELE